MRALVTQGMERRRVRTELRAVLRAGRLHAHRGSDRAGTGRRARWAASTSRTCATRPRGLQESVRETIAIGEKGGLPTQITHHKVVGKKYWGGSVQTLRMVDEARARGVDATIDQYPYTASATSIGAALLPAWAQEGGRDATLKRLKDPATRAKIKAESVAIIRDERGGGDPKNVSVSACQFDPTLAGQNLAQITQGRGLAGHARERRGNRAVDRRAGRLRRHLPRHRRRGSAAHPRAPGDDDRLGRRGRGLRPQRAAPAQLRHLRARARPLRARQEAAAAGDRGAEDVGVPGAAPRA